MEKNVKNPKKAGGNTADPAIDVGWSREEILAKAKALLSVGDLWARREIVRTALQLDQLLAGGGDNVE